MNKLSLLFCSLAVLPVFSKTLIITHAYNRPDFIEIQAKTFKKLIQDDYEFVVFNDAVDRNLEIQINNMCAKYELKCLRVPQEIHTRPYLPRAPSDPLHRPNIRHVNCVQYSLDVLGFDHDDIVFIIDSDMFLVRPLNISEYMKNKDIASPIRGADHGVGYLWPALCFLKMHQLPDKKTLNFNCGMIDGAVVDAGGWSWSYIKNHRRLNIIDIDVIYSYKLFCLHNIEKVKVDINAPVSLKRATYLLYGFNEKEIKFLLRRPDTFEFYMGNHFLHYRAGTNYNNLSPEYHNHKMMLINELVADIIN